MSEHKSYYKSFITMLSGNTLSQLIPFVMAPILTHLFSPEEFAISVNYLAIATMVGIVAAGRLEMAIPISKHKSGAQEIVFTGLMITFTLSLLSVVFPLFADDFARLYKSPELADFLYTIPLAVMSIGLLGIANNWVLRHKKYSVLSFAKVSQSLVNNGLAALLGYYQWGVNGLIVGWLASQLVGIMVLLFSMNLNINVKNYRITTVKTTIKEYKDFPLINSLHAFTDIFATQFLLYWIISSQFGLVELGLFAIMHRYVRQPVVLVSSSVSTIFYAEVSSAINEDKNALPYFWRTIKTSLIFGIPFSIVLLLFAPQIFGWYLGDEWAMAGEYSRAILPILFLMFIVSPVSGIPILFNRQRTAYLITSIGYFFTLGSFFVATFFNWTFIDALLLYGTVYGVLQIVYLVWMYSLIKKPNAYTR